MHNLVNFIFLFISFLANFNKLFQNFVKSPSLFSEHKQARRPVQYISPWAAYHYGT